MTASAPAADVAVSPLDPSDPAGAAEWDAYVEGHADGSAYHLTAARAFVAEAFGHETHWLVARRAGRVAGVLPMVLVRSALFGHYLVSMPYFNYGGILASDDAAREALSWAAAATCRWVGARHVELRHARPHEHLRLPARTSKVEMLLELPRTVEELWKALQSRIRNQIRQAQQAGLGVEEGGADKLDDFYAVFVRNMRDLGTPVYPRRFFSAFLRQFQDRTRIFIVRHPNGTPIASAVTVTYRGRSEVPWASSIRDYNALRPNNLVYWTMIERAIERGESVFDFGRSTEDGGTYRFKLGFNARPRRCYWHYFLPDGGDLPALNPDNPKYKLAIKIWQHLPLAVTRLVGPRIVRGLP